jgi:cell division transport system ATP-binding protein
MDLIAHASARGTTVMVATHDHSLVERYGRRTLQLEGGRVKEDIAAAGPRR